MPDSPHNKPSSEKSEAPGIVPANHANIIAENLRRIDAALPLVPLTQNSDASVGRQAQHDETPRSPHQPSVRSPENSGGR